MYIFFFPGLLQSTACFTFFVAQHSLNCVSCMWWKVTQSIARRRATAVPHALSATRMCSTRPQFKYAKRGNSSFCASGGMQSLVNFTLA
uniref:Secreted protein n=1 Tax=Rhipicephalus appendiculatus TaxID=34631 RepID=A0A131YFN1_RHIAP